MKLSTALIGVNLLGIETAPFIYYTESRPGYVDKMRMIFQAVFNAQVRVATSTLTLTECLTKPLRDQDAALVTAYQAMLRQTRGITLLPVNTTVAARAADLRARYNLRTPDALHVATALTAGCDAFLTNDLGLKRVQEVRILILDELEMDRS